MDDLIAQSLGKYSKLEEIGRGGMGVVYKARDTERNIDVAIKTIPPDLTHHREFLQRFQQEARALMRLHHPHIVGLIDLVEDQGNHYMVLEYVDGPSLAELLTKGPLPRERAREIALQVCEALTHAHEHNIVHRDIKPSNILLTQDGLAKVTDFGIARVLDATLGTLTGKVFGTARYASPEQVKGLKVDARSDLYSLGVVLYEMLTGRPPFLGTDDEVMEQHVRAKPVPPRQWREEIPEGTEAIVLRCLDKDRDSRYQTAQELAGDLRGGQLARRPVAGEKKGERDHGRRKPIAVLAVIAVVVVMGLGALAVVVRPWSGSGLDRTIAPAPGGITPAHQSSSTGTATEGPPAAEQTQLAVSTPVEASLAPSATPFVGKIAFLSDRDHQDVESAYSWRPLELYLMNPDGSDQRRLTWGDTPLSDTGLPPRRVFWLNENTVVVDESGAGDRALLVDATDGSVIETIHFRTTADGMDVYGFLTDWSPDGSRVALDGSRPDSPDDLDCALWISDADGSNWKRITDWREDCDYGPVWSPNGTWLAFARINPRVERGLYVMHADGTGLQLLAGDLEFGDTRTWSPDGRFIATDVWNNTDIAIIEVETGTVKNVTNSPAIAGRGEFHPSWSPDGTQIAFHSGDLQSPEIWIMNADGSGAHKIADGCCPAWQPAPRTPAPEATGAVVSQTPTGVAGTVARGRIGFDSHQDGEFNAEIYVMNADGSGQTNLTNNSAGDYYPSWSPDGTRIVFMSGRDGNFGIYVMSADGSNVTRLTNSQASDTWPSWSPDGDRVAFVSDRDGNNEIYVMNIDGSGVTRLTYNTVGDGWPTWSPDSTRIAFVRGSQVYVMDADGSNARSLFEGQSPSWSPDGTRIAFESKRDGNSEIYAIKADGAGVTRLTDNSADDWYPSWCPDGRHIVFQSNRDGDFEFEIYRMRDDGTEVVRLTRNPGDDGHPSCSPR